MTAQFRRTDAFIEKLIHLVLRFPWPVVLICLVLTAALSAGAGRLGIANNYRVYFSDQNPELSAFEKFQATYTKSDNFFFMIRPKSGDGFSREALLATEELTESSWKLPYATRVDSVTNFQHSHADDDTLVVEKLIGSVSALSPGEILAKREIALGEPLLAGLLVSRDGSALAVNVALQYPEKSLTEVPSAAAAARELQDRIQAKYPSAEILLSGTSMLNNAFAEAGLYDTIVLVPAMFLVLFFVTLLISGSLAGTSIIFLMISTSAVAAMGWAGFAGIQLSPIAFAAPTVIATVAVADAIHLLIAVRDELRRGTSQFEAIAKATRENFVAILLTSVTTVIGFLALNGSDAPPFRHLGNITAVGVTIACVLTFTLLPAAFLIAGIKRPRTPKGTASRPAMDLVANWIVGHRRALVVLMPLSAAAMIMCLPLVNFSDNWFEYIDESIEFRQQSDQVLKKFGLSPIEFSLPSGEAGGVSNPEYLRKVAAFVDYAGRQENVTHVYSLIDILSRLNRNMNGDDPAFNRLPDNREVTAQYLLLYEMSLPFGLDLNDRINIDKSATRVTVMLGDVTTAQTKRFLQDASAWLAANTPEMAVTPTGAPVMVAYIAERNVSSMISSSVLAVLAISLTIALVLRSLKLGLLSLVANGLPILATFGLWGLTVGSVGFSIAAVASVSMGIIVDDTVHILTKYVRIRQETELSPQDAIRKVISTVGYALVGNSLILLCGFMILTLSTFKVNVDMGLLTSLTIILALAFNFLLVGPVLCLKQKAE